jgi:L,D-peptidoglycan transpeptidase YkuD (ErfK/YbiS/YcfS/YnhG family)
MLSRASLVIVIVLAFCTAACGDDDPSMMPDAQVSTDAGLDTAAPGDATASSDGGTDLTTPSQRIVVLADNETTYKAAMYAFERTAGGWSKLFSHPVTLGKNGLAWGRGLHAAADLPKGAKMKQEGDGKSPMGLFALTQGWGYLAPASVATKLPYTTATDKLICVDDVGSSYYNQVIDWQAEGLTAGSLPSHEKMLLSSVVYKYTIFVAHNTPNAQPGAGSCIFLHLWSGADGYTAGCTAMAEPDMLALLGWLDPARSPLLVQLTRVEYARLKGAWNLPTL